MKKELSLFAILLASLNAHAACFAPDDVIELKGVLIQKAAYVDPSELGWAPKNGFVTYTAFVMQDPICLDDPDYGAKLENIRVIQVGWDGTGGAYSDNELSNGTLVTVKGSLFPRSTSHHFQDVLMSPARITRVH